MIDFCTTHLYDLITICLGTVLSILSWVLSKKHHSEQLRSYVPTIWTSLGIFFTFLSIYLTLSNMAMLEDEKIQITAIIRGIIPAFSTSVIGILGAIITAYTDRWMKSREESSDNRDFEKFSRGETSTLGDIQTPDLILLELVREISASITQTHRLITDFSQAIEKTVNQSTDFILEALNDHKEATIKNQNQIQQEQRLQLQAYVEKFVAEANETHKKQINDILAKFDVESEKREEKHIGLLREFAETARTNNDLIKDSLCKEAESRQAEIKSMVESEKSELSAFVFGQNKMLEESLSLSNATINNAVEKINALFETEIKSDIAQFAQQEYEKCVELIDAEYRTFFENSEKVLANQEKNNAEYLSLLSGVLQETHNNVIRDLNQLKEAMLSHLNKLNDENAERIEGILHQHTEDFHSLSAEVQSLEANHLSAIAGIYQTGEEKISEAIKEQTQRIDEALSVYRNALDTFGSSVTTISQQMTKDMEKFCGELDSRTEKLEKEHLIEVERIHKESDEKIKVANESLSKEISQTISSIQELRTEVQASAAGYITIHADIKKQISDKTTELIKAMSDRFNDSAQIKVIESACESLVGKLNATINALEKKDQMIMQSLDNVANSIEAYSKVADDTKLLNEYVHSTIGLYKEHSTQMETLETNLQDIMRTISDSLMTIKTVSSNNKTEPKHPTNNKAQ